MPDRISESIFSARKTDRLSASIYSNQKTESIFNVQKILTQIATSVPGANISKTGHYLTDSEIHAIKSSWAKLIGDDSCSHGINMFINFFKKYPELRNQHFGFLANMNEEEMLKSPRLSAVGSGMVLGVTQIINGLENPLVVSEVAYKFSKSHYRRGIKETSVRLLIPVVMEYLESAGGGVVDSLTKDAYRKMFDHFLRLVEQKMTSMEEDERKEAKARNVKNNAKMLGIALVALVIEKLCDFIMALLGNKSIWGSAEGNSSCDCSICPNNTILDHGPGR